MKIVINKKIEELNKMLLDFFQMTKKQHLSCIEALEKKDFKLLEKIHERELKINKIYHVIFKKIVYHLVIFNTYGKELRNLLTLAFTINEIERIADYADNIAQFYKIETGFAFDTKILIKAWKKLLFRFEQVEKLIKKPETVLIKEDLEKNHKFDMNEIFVELEKVKDMHTKVDFSRKMYYFFLQFKFLDRSYDHLTNIVEYLLFQKSFFDFRSFQKGR